MRERVQGPGRGRARQGDVDAVGREQRVLGDRLELGPARVERRLQSVADLVRARPDARDGRSCGERPERALDLANGALRPRTRDLRRVELLDVVGGRGDRARPARRAPSSRSRMAPAASMARRV